MDIVNHLSNYQKNLNFYTENQKVIAGNIANADTPNYRAVYLEKLETQQGTLPLATTNKNHLTKQLNGDATNGTLRYQNNKHANLDGNDVDIDGERKRLLENGFMYQLKTVQIGKAIEEYKKAIGGQ